VTLQELIAHARARITRLRPHDAWADAQDGAVIVDIRGAPAEVVPGSLHIPRTVLEWRLDPESPWRSPFAPGLDDRVIVLCEHGESSSLAAAILGNLGFARVADVIGGFEAWLEAELPVVETRPYDGLVGTGPPQT
jgi:rhodanese-related sulfurtransferase